MLVSTSCCCQRADAEAAAKAKPVSWLSGAESMLRRVVQAKLAADAAEADVEAAVRSN
jgi:hypothetical protein